MSIGKLFMSDVGDGLSVQLEIPGGHGVNGGKVALIDIGSNNDPRGHIAFKSYLRAYRFMERSPDIFILSHFHVDHYNGLFVMERLGYPMSISYLYYPGIPQVWGQPTLSTKFATVALVINVYLTLRTLGSSGTPLDMDLISLFHRINLVKFEYKPLFLGDTITIGNQRIKILWPPRVISSGSSIAKSMRNAVETFWNAVEKSPELRELYEAYSKKAEHYWNPKDVSDISPFDYTDEETLDEKLGDRRHDIKRDPIREANEKLRKVANRLSIAFKTLGRDSLLFMGDLEPNEINNVARLLKNQNGWNILITPHHGTHWGYKLQNFQIGCALSSVGPKLRYNLDPRFDNISRIHLNTYDFGDIACPIW